MLRRIIGFNEYLSDKFEGIFSFNKNDKLLLFKLLNDRESYSRIADVGGGKKPIISQVPYGLGSGQVYDGFDISLSELKQAGKIYSEYFHIDLTKKNENLVNQYDLVFCVNTLEHVTDTDIAVSNLSKLTRESGILYIKIPCKLAVFAILNTWLPNFFTNSIMHYIYPHKAGDGFKAFYDSATPSELVTILKSHDYEVLEINKVKWSSYFRFFFPLYIAWRVITLLQNYLSTDYCESFEVVCKKREYFRTSE